MPLLSLVMVYHQGQNGSGEGNGPVRVTKGAFTPGARAWIRARLTAKSSPPETRWAQKVLLGTVNTFVIDRLDTELPYQDQ